METNLSPKKIKKESNGNTKRKWCMDKLKKEEIRRDFNEKVNGLLKETKSKRNQNNVEEEWDKLRNRIAKEQRKSISNTLKKCQQNHG